MKAILRTQAVVSVLLGALSVGAALAQDYPSRPIRLIVPAPAGGAHRCSGAARRAEAE